MNLVFHLGLQTIQNVLRTDLMALMACEVHSFVRMHVRHSLTVTVFEGV